MLSFNIFQILRKSSRCIVSLFAAEITFLVEDTWQYLAGKRAITTPDKRQQNPVERWTHAA